MILFKNKQQALNTRKKFHNILLDEHNIMKNKNTRDLKNLGRAEEVITQCNDYLRSESLKELDRQLGII